MANWKYKLELKDIMKKYENERISIKELGGLVSKRIQEHEAYRRDYGLQYIAAQFDDLGDDAEEDDFDCILEDLYNWGDEFHTCWINTI